MNFTTNTFYNAEEKLWFGPKGKNFYGPNITLGEAALYILSRNPEKVIQVMDTTGEQMTAAELIHDSKMVALQLMKFGLRPGDVVGISGNNTTHLTAVAFGALLCGTPTHALYPGFDKESIELVYEVTRPKIVFCDVENYDTMQAAIAAIGLKVNIFLLNGELPNVKNVKELLIDDGNNKLENISFPCMALTGDDTAAILCSSGTTGTPKGTCCSHSTLLNRPGFATLQSDSVLCTFSTLYWASGLFTFVASLVHGVKRIITDKPFTPAYYVELIEKYGITHLIGAPNQMAQLLQNATPALRPRLQTVDSMLCAGSKVPKIVSEKMNRILGDKPRIGLAAAYGMSEIASMLSLNDGGPDKRRDGTEGKLLPNTEVRIIDKETNEPLGPNKAGILHIRIPFKWAGYFNNPEATNKAYVNGWLISGDIGFFDDDGFLHICTRDNDVFKSNNFQIYPEQIEGVILQLPGVLEACVFGVPDFVAGNLTACAIVRAENAAGKALTTSDIIEHVNQNLSQVYHIRAGVYFIEALPKTGSGKTQRRKVYEVIKNIGQ